MPDFKHRSQQIEIMDDLDCKGQVVDQTLHELETINRLLGGNYVTLNGIDKLLCNKNKSHIYTLADLGCGGGDVLKLIAKWAIDKRYSLNLYGIDANRNIIDFAKTNSKSFPQIKYEPLDIFSESFEAKTYDIVTGTLFFHHFNSNELASFFRQLKAQVKVGFVINDIHRNWFAYYSIKWLTKFFSKSDMVKYDAPLSVLRAFRKKELIEILEKAEIKNYSLRWMWAFRWQVVVKVNSQ